MALRSSSHSHQAATADLAHGSTAPANALGGTAPAVVFSTASRHASGDTATGGADLTARCAVLQVESARRARVEAMLVQAAPLLARDAVRDGDAAVGCSAVHAPSMDLPWTFHEPSMSLPEPSIDGAAAHAVGRSAVHAAQPSGEAEVLIGRLHADEPRRPHS